MIQQNYETIQRRIALKLYKGIKPLPIPIPYFQCQNQKLLLQKWNSFQLEIQQKINQLNRKLYKLESEITQLKKILSINQKKMNFQKTTAHKSQQNKKYAKQKRDSLSSLHFKSVPILKFNNSEKQDNLLMGLCDQQDQDKKSAQYSFCQSDQKMKKISLTNPKSEKLKQKQLILFTHKVSNNNCEKIFYKQIGINTTNQDQQKKISPFSKATEAEPQQSENQTSFNNDQMQMLKEQIRKLKNIIISTHHIHITQQESQKGSELFVNSQKQKQKFLKSQQYWVKVQHYKNQNEDLRKTILQLKYEISLKNNQIQDYCELLIKLKQAISGLKNQAYSQLLPCQYCSFKNYLNLKIQEDNDRFAIKYQ